MITVLAMATRRMRSEQRVARRLDRAADGDGDAELTAYNDHLESLTRLERRPVADGPSEAWGIAAKAFRSRLAPASMRVAALAWKIAGIILYTGPLPTPVSANRTVNAATNCGTDPEWEAASTSAEVTIIATTFHSVTREPRSRSAIAPPTGRMSDPTNAPTHAV